jgi:colanic acid biosynthesis protein WcaH
VRDFGDYRWSWRFLMLNSDMFNLIVKNTPLVSIDLCIVCNGRILLGLRNNAPLKGMWFTPGVGGF